MAIDTDCKRGRFACRLAGLMSLAMAVHSTCLAAASSVGQVAFNSVTFMDLADDGVAPGLSWGSPASFDGVLDTEADNFGSSDADQLLLKDFGSGRVQSVSSPALAQASLLALNGFFGQALAQGSSGSEGYYQGIAHAVAVVMLTPHTRATFSGYTWATAIAGPGPYDYAKGNAFISIGALEGTPATPVSCSVSDDNNCVRPFLFVVENLGAAAAEVGIEVAASVEGFSSPVPEPSSFALFLVALAGVVVTAKATRNSNLSAQNSHPRVRDGNSV